MPDLQVIAEFLDGELTGSVVEAADVRKPIVVRDLTRRGFSSHLAGKRVRGVSRRGKFLLFALASGDWLVVKPMLSGRLRYLAPGARPHGKPFVVLRFADGACLQYTDRDKMGKVYLADRLDAVPTFADQGREALDPEFTREDFAALLSRRRGEIKGLLVNQTLIAGIGNAYADEILFSAKVYPFRKAPSLSREEIGRIHEAIRSVLREALEILRARVGADIHLEIRDFLQVHGRGGQPCPRCGTPVSQITARRRLTNFCRTCQPGTMISQ